MCGDSRCHHFCPVISREERQVARPTCRPSPGVEGRNRGAAGSGKPEPLETVPCLPLSGEHLPTPTHRAHSSLGKDSQTGPRGLDLGERGAGGGVCRASPWASPREGLLWLCSLLLCGASREPQPPDGLSEDCMRMLAWGVLVPLLGFPSVVGALWSLPLGCLPHCACPPPLPA